MELVYRADKAITADKKAKRCDNDPNHGKLFPHGSGAFLICSKCGYQAHLDPHAYDN